jgi:hypothetical protein
MQSICMQKPVLRLGPVFIDFVIVKMESVEFAPGCTVGLLSVLFTKLQGCIQYVVSRVYIYRAVSGRIQGTVSGLPPQFRLNTPRQALLQMVK